jgi:subtilisin family serine protease
VLRARALVPFTIAAALVSAYTATAASATGTAPSTVKVLVKFSPTATAADRASADSAVGATDVGTVRDLGVHVLSVSAVAADNVIAALSHHADVVYAEPDATTQATQTPNDSDWPNEWGPMVVNAPTAWNTTTGSANTVIALLDTGADSTHPDLQGRLVAGYDFVNNDSNPSDDNGHGTAVAGIAGAATNNSTGLAGMCWSCSLMPVKVLGSNGSGDYATLANGITWATDHGADVISMSLVGSTDSSTLHSAVQYAHSHGVVLVSAAGNFGTSTPYYPAAYPEVLGVAGTDDTNALYSWSDYGSWVKIAAPGCNDATMLGASYGTLCGTSAATPLAAGVVGLLRSAYPSATNAQVEAALESSAVKVGTTVACGRIDAAAALSAMTTGSTSASCAAGSGGSTGGTTGGTTGGKSGGGKKH